LPDHQKDSALSTIPQRRRAFADREDERAGVVWRGTVECIANLNKNPSPLPEPGPMANEIWMITKT
jgi:hypothetical protein